MLFGVMKLIAVLTLVITAWTFTSCTTLNNRRDLYSPSRATEDTTVQVVDPLALP